MVLHRARIYSGDSLYDAMLIIEDVMKVTQSAGWSGDIKNKEAVEKILLLFNVEYTDDMYGTWEMKKEEDELLGPAEVIDKAYVVRDVFLEKVNPNYHEGEKTQLTDEELLEHMDRVIDLLEVVKEKGG